MQSNPAVHRVAVAKYQKNNPYVYRASVARYTENHPEVHRAAVATYQENHPEIHRAAQSRFKQNNPGKRVEKRLLPWKIKVCTGMAYDPNVAYESDSTVSLGTMSHKCNALKWKDETPGTCCNAGKVQLPSFQHLPEPLNSLLMKSYPDHFMNRIRKYNGCFQMTSFGAKQVAEDGFMLTFKFRGKCIAW